MTPAAVVAALADRSFIVAERTVRERA